MLGIFSADDVLKYLSCFFCFFFVFVFSLFFFSQKKIRFMISCRFALNIQLLYFLRKIRKIINLLSAEFAQRVLKVNDITVHVYLMVFNT